MTLDALQILIQEGEGTTLEFKESLSSSFARELVALANTIGGKVLLGVRDDGTVVGVQDTNTLRARIQDIARNCDPPVQVLAEPVGGVFAVHVRESDSKPVQCSDGFFWRQGAVTQKLSRDEIRDLFRLEGAVRFALAPCVRFSYPEDFDREKFDVWLSLSGITGRPQVEDVLVNIEAAERADGTLFFRNAGALFFAKNVRRFFPQAYITCLLARGLTRFTSWIGRTSMAGSWRTSRTPCASSSAIRARHIASRASGAKMSRSIRPTPYERRSRTPSCTATGLWKGPTSSSRSTPTVWKW